MFTYQITITATGYRTINNNDERFLHSSLDAGGVLTVGCVGSYFVKADKRVSIDHAWGRKNIAHS
jgi:hypothetical protein